MARILGIDPGTRRCGVAITDSAQTMAFPRPALAVDETLMSALAELIQVESVALIVVGRPVALSGKVTASTTLADQLYESILRTLPDTAAIQWDERLTTLEAQRSLSGAGMKAKQHREHIDSAAAVIMLQNYLDGLNAL
jgi:putative Holliday junction resolvase